MPRHEPATRGRDLAQRLRNASREVEQSPRPGARDLPVLRGVNPKSVFFEPLENVRADATRILVDSGRIYVHGDAIVLESSVGGRHRLEPLARGGAVESSAAASLANVAICEQVVPDRPTVQFAMPQPVVALVLASAPTRAALPTVVTYATRPVFDDNFRLLTQGWHPESGTLVHGPEIDPWLDPPPAPGGRALDRLPPRLRDLLANFCFGSDSDLVAAVAMMLTGLLANHFVASGKAVALIDGNQPGLGKTLLARVLGILLDGADPRLLHYTPDDEELAKRICATLRGGNQSVIIVDNAKLRAGAAISSPVLEANSMAPKVSMRILGRSENIERPNDLVWVITMNDTRTSPDLVSRGLPIRLRLDGDPGRRNFAGSDPIAYAIEHRAELLGELAGMVIRWVQAGQPDGTHGHRCDRWARVIGGILEVAGLPEFLANADEAAATFNVGLQDLAALAEVAMISDPRTIEPARAGDDPPAQGRKRKRKKDVPGLLAGEWVALFRRANVLTGALDYAKGERAKATVIGNYLRTNLGRPVPILVQDCPGEAMLVSHKAGQNQTRYAFAVGWEGDPPPNLRPDGKSEDDEDSEPPRSGRARVGRWEE